jgi:hypothetical protein
MNKEQSAKAALEFDLRRAPIPVGAGTDPASLGSLFTDVDAIDPVRSELDDWRISLHESGHVVVGRAQGQEVGGATIVGGPDYGGMTANVIGETASANSVRLRPTASDGQTAAAPAANIGAATMDAPAQPRISQTLSPIRAASDTLPSIQRNRSIGLDRISAAATTPNVIKGNA